eukprot:Sro343_g121970.3  (364) ;mRNA; r:24654-25745
MGNGTDPVAGNSTAVNNNNTATNPPLLGNNTNATDIPTLSPTINSTNSSSTPITGTIAPTVLNGTDPVAGNSSTTVNNNNTATNPPLLRNNTNATDIPTLSPTINLTNSSTLISSTIAPTVLNGTDPGAGNSSTTVNNNTVTTPPQVGNNTQSANNMTTTTNNSTMAPSTTIPGQGTNATTSNTTTIQTPSNATNGNATAAVRTGNVARTKSLTFRAQLEIVFFEGEGREPTAAEVDALMGETELFFVHLFTTTNSSIRNAFVSFDVDHVDSTYYDDANNATDRFQVDFDAILQVEQGSAATTLVTMDTIAMVVDHADYNDYISNYVWLSEPFMRNEFYQTHQVTLTCHALGINVQRRMAKQQ